MAIRQGGQVRFGEALLPQSLGRNGRLDRLSALVKWYRFEKLLKDLRDAASPGRPGYQPLVLFKALLLQSLYGLSDVALEDALADRLSFRKFIGLSLEDAIPDSTTLCRFRNLLIEAKRLEKLFGELDRQLEQAGVMLQRGTMLDATLIETAAASRPQGDHGSADPDARFAKRPRKAGPGLRDKGHAGRSRARAAMPARH